MTEHKYTEIMLMFKEVNALAKVLTFVPCH